MKFQIYRTSNYSDRDNPKVEKAKKEILKYHYNAYTPHGGTPIYARDEMKECWTIEINTLEELIALAKSQKSPIILGLPYDEGEGFQLHSIEIYDGYRE